MFKIKPSLIALLVLFSVLGWSQQTIENDPELIQNNIDHYIKQAQLALEADDNYEALRNLDDALALAQKTEKQESKGLIYSFKGRLQLIIDQPDKAIASLNKSIEIQRLTKDDANLARSFKTLGEVFISKKDYYQALDYFISAKTLFQQVELENKLAETLLLEGKTYMLLNNYKKARTTLEQALALSRKNNFLSTESESLINQGIVYSELRDYKHGLQATAEGLKIAKANNFVNLKNLAYKVLSDISYSLNDFKKSRDYLIAHTELSDSIRGLKIDLEKNQFNLPLLNNMSAELEQVNKKLEKKEAESTINTLISVLSVALITILSLLTLSLYKNNNIRLKTNNMLHKKNGELILAKEKAELASKTKANFLSTVTHELRTPLYAVTGLSNMLLEENPKPEQIQHLKSLKFSGDYLLTFINDILQINKIEANKVDLEPEPFNLNKKINNIVLALTNSAEDNNVNLHFEYDKDLPENFIADQLKISQILINLVGNSIKFTKDGDIWIRVYKIDQIDKIYTLRFEVEDNGIGITQEKQDHMFESFSQGSIQINRKYGGTGLGLSIVKGLIEILKGQIYLKSEIGKGTTFYFEIPIEFSAIKEAQEVKADYFEGNKEELDLKNVRILVVEDNKINQMITKKILTKMELQCEITDNGEDAVEKIKANDYNIILMDIHMPGISGIEATKRIRMFDKDLTIFALTAVTIEDKMHEFDEAGFTDIIPKPFKQDEFEKKLYNALASKKNISTTS
ncbi:ATP-binding protein [Algibacter sp. L4_22]|uniref:ATP-binding response regulator n=1 Tax=Algibacter sp. L4_22 TaxID=2942477 RepID=UPI00201B5266|nr:ATP-binding protein [Algibacter sp. L4_22]MCL5130392.1 ATP-binding protein [Algibacter sp. L4_22]